MGATGLQGNGTAALAPGSLIIWNRAVLPSIGGAAGSVKSSGHRTLLGRVTLIFHRHRLLPHRGLGGLGPDKKAPLKGGGPSLEICSQIIIPD